MGNPLRKKRKKEGIGLMGYLALAGFTGLLTLGMIYYIDNEVVGKAPSSETSKGRAKKIRGQKSVPPSRPMAKKVASPAKKPAPVTLGEKEKNPFAKPGTPLEANASAHSPLPVASPGKALGSVAATAATPRVKRKEGAKKGKEKSVDYSNIANYGVGGYVVKIRGRDDAPVIIGPVGLIRNTEIEVHFGKSGRDAVLTGHGVIVDGETGRRFHIPENARIPVRMEGATFTTKPRGGVCKKKRITPSEAMEIVAFDHPDIRLSYKKAAPPDGGKPADERSSFLDIFYGNSDRVAVRIIGIGKDHVDYRLCDVKWNDRFFSDIGTAVRNLAMHAAGFYPEDEAFFATQAGGVKQIRGYKRKTEKRAHSIVEIPKLEKTDMDNPEIVGRDAYDILPPPEKEVPLPKVY